MYIHYIYIYILSLSLSPYMYVFVYIYIYIIISLSSTEARRAGSKLIRRWRLLFDYIITIISIFDIITNLLIL